jgi:AraC-like DNA-binding protein
MAMPHDDPAPAPAPAAAEQPATAYRESAPPAAAREHLVCVWSQQIGDAPRAQPVLPDACVDIVWVGDAEPVVAGPATRPFVAALPAGAIVVGARFRPGGSAGVLGVDASELQDRHVALRDVAPRLARRFSTLVADQATVEAKAAAAAALLARHLPDLPPADALARAAVRWLAEHPEGRVHDLGRALHLSERQLQRRLPGSVGYAPKVLHRILRFQRLLALAAARPDSPLAALALRAGFADQAHMTRELGRLAGRSPAALLSGAAGSALRLAELF